MDPTTVADTPRRLETLDYTTVAEAKAELDRLIDGFVVDGARIILTRDGEEVAALVHPDDAYYLQEAEDRLDIAAAEEALAKVAEHGTVPWEQVKAELDADREAELTPVR
jgi:PHD/YefM family antitoxin component YafN of YafNO toxin-antitoxin module